MSLQLQYEGLWPEMLASRKTVQDSRGLPAPLKSHTAVIFVWRERSRGEFYLFILGF